MFIADPPVPPSMSLAQEGGGVFRGMKRGTHLYVG